MHSVLNQKNGPSLSFWEQTSFLPSADVAIVGSGIVGLTAAIGLKTARPAWHITVLERGVLPSGASTKNAGFACFGSMTELMDDLQQSSTDEVFSLVEKRWRGLQRLRELVGDAAIDYHGWGGYELFPAQDETYRACLDALPDFNRQLSTITGLSDTFVVNDSGMIQGFGFQGVNGMIWNQAEGQIDTGKMMQALLKKARSLGIEIVTGLEVTHWEEESGNLNLAFSNGWRLKSERLLLATNGFTTRFFPELDIMPARNQVLVTEPIADLPFSACFHYDRGYYYFRRIGDRVLLGGGRHLASEAEQTAEFGTTPQIREALLQILNEMILPGREVQVASWWSGILGIGQRKRAIVQNKGGGVFLAARLGGMGVAIGSLVGEDAAELILQA